MNVFLDDYRPCPAGFVLAKNVEECIALLEEYDVGVLSLDFDLGWGQPNGLELVRLMVERGRFAAEIYMHSSSASGRQYMYELLSKHVPDGTRLSIHPVPLARMESIRRQWERGEAR